LTRGGGRCRCVINESPDRHPMHLHANRFWILGVGDGGLQECINSGTKVGAEP
jgi:FtsP/CotA-like multicopper oxidase with cupredoxin domain